MSRFYSQDKQNAENLVRIFFAENVNQGKRKAFIKQKISIVIYDCLSELIKQRN